MPSQLNRGPSLEPGQSNLRRSGLLAQKNTTLVDATVAARKATTGIRAAGRSPLVRS